MNFITKIFQNVRNAIRAPWDFFTALLTPNSGKSSKRYLYLLMGLNVMAALWYILIVSRKTTFQNVDLIKYSINAHVWVILGLAGAVTALSLMNISKGAQLPPGGSNNDIPENTNSKGEQNAITSPTAQSEQSETNNEVKDMVEEENENKQQ